MIKSGAFDGLAAEPPGASCSCSDRRAAERRAGGAGGGGRPGRLVRAQRAAADDSPRRPRRRSTSDMSGTRPKLLVLRNEKEALGLYLSGHPFDAKCGEDAGYFVDAQAWPFCLSAEPPPQIQRAATGILRERRAGRSRVAGLIVDIRKSAATGSRVVLDDDTGRHRGQRCSREAYDEFREPAAQ